MLVAMALSANNCCELRLASKTTQTYRQPILTHENGIRSGRRIYYIYAGRGGPDRGLDGGRGITVITWIPYPPPQIVMRSVTLCTTSRYACCCATGRDSGRA